MTKYQLEDMNEVCSREFAIPNSFVTNLRQLGGAECLLCWTIQHQYTPAAPASETCARGSRANAHGLSGALHGQRPLQPTAATVQHRTQIT